MDNHTDVATKWFFLEVALRRALEIATGCLTLKKLFSALPERGYQCHHLRTPYHCPLSNRPVGGVQTCPSQRMARGRGQLNCFMAAKSPTVGRLNTSRLRFAKDSVLRGGYIVNAFTTVLETGPSRVRFSKAACMCWRPRFPRRLRRGPPMGSVDRWPMAIATKPDIRGHAETNIRPRA